MITMSICSPSMMDVLSMSSAFLSATDDLAQQRRTESCFPAVYSTHLPDIAAGSWCTLRREDANGVIVY